MHSPLSHNNLIAYYILNTVLNWKLVYHITMSVDMVYVSKTKKGKQIGCEKNIKLILSET